MSLGTMVQLHLRMPAGVAYDVRFLWNMTSILATKAEQCLAIDMIAHETGTAPSSQCQTCYVARNVSHRMAKR